MSKAAELAKMGEVLTNSQIGGRRNLIINGAMQVAQRSTSATGLGAASGYFGLDRYKIFFNTAGRLTMTQTADGPVGFANCLKLDCTTADTSIAATENIILSQPIEAQDLQQLKKGTSDAEKITLSFYVKGNANAGYTVEIYDGINDRRIGQTFSVTTDWTKVILTFPADTAGALADSNATGLFINWWLHAGSNFTGGTFDTTWADYVQNRRVGNTTSFLDSTNRTFFLTGVQLEVGSVATPFEHRSFGEELALCQRYYVQIGPYPSSQGAGALAIFATADGNSGFSLIDFPVYMRAEPTLTHTGTATDYNLYVANANKAGSGGFSVSSGDTLKHTLLYTEHSSTTTAGQVGTLTTASNNTDAFLGFVAEL